MGVANTGKLGLSLIGDVKITGHQLQKNEFIKPLRNKVRMAAAQAAPAIEKRLKELISKTLMDSPTVASLISGSLKHELGIPDGIVKARVIIEKWADSLHIVTKDLKARPSLILQARGIKSSYADVLGLPEAKQANVGPTGRPTPRAAAGRSPKERPWLRWLLLEGTNVVAAGFELHMVNHARSRTGTGIMKEGTLGYSVRTVYAGVSGDNFVTQALKTVEGEVEKIFKSEMQSGFIQLK